MVDKITDFDEWVKEHGHQGMGWRNGLKDRIRWMHELLKETEDLNGIRNTWMHIMIQTYFTLYGAEKAWELAYQDFNYLTTHSNNKCYERFFWCEITHMIDLFYRRCRDNQGVMYVGMSAYGEPIEREVSGEYWYTNERIKEKLHISEEVAAKIGISRIRYAREKSKLNVAAKVEKYKKIAELYLSGTSRRKVADVLGLSEDTVKDI